MPIFIFKFPLLHPVFLLKHFWSLHFFIATTIIVKTWQNICIFNSMRGKDFLSLFTVWKGLSQIFCKKLVINFLLGKWHSISWSTIFISLCWRRMAWHMSKNRKCLKKGEYLKCIGVVKVPTSSHKVFWNKMSRIDFLFSVTSLLFLHFCVIKRLKKSHQIQIYCRSCKAYFNIEMHRFMLSFLMCGLKQK